MTPECKAGLDDLEEWRALASNAVYCLENEVKRLRGENEQLRVGRREGDMTPECCELIEDIQRATAAVQGLRWWQWCLRTPAERAARTQLRQALERARTHLLASTDPDETCRLAPVVLDAAVVWFGKRPQRSLKPCL